MNRYARQWEMWGEDGQYVLGQSKVCVIGLTQIGVEILKNLIVSGVGGFVVVARKNEEIGRFLKPYESGDELIDDLKQLNPECGGSLEICDEWDQTHLIDLAQRCSLTVCSTRTDADCLEHVENCLWKNNIPFVAAWVNGFKGYVKIVVREHWVVGPGSSESKYVGKLGQRGEYGYAGQETASPDPTVCTVVGGIVSQEIFKILTHKHMPIRNGLVYCGTRISFVVW